MAHPKRMGHFSVLLQVMFKRHGRTNLDNIGMVSSSPLSVERKQSQYHARSHAYGPSQCNVNAGIVVYGQDAVRKVAAAAYYLAVGGRDNHQAFPGQRMVGFRHDPFYESFPLKQSKGVEHVNGPPGAGEYRLEIFQFQDYAELRNGCLLSDPKRFFLAAET